MVLDSVFLDTSVLKGGNRGLMAIFALFMGNSPHIGVFRKIKVGGGKTNLISG